MGTSILAQAADLSGVRSICELSKDAQVLTGTVVRVRALFVSDNLEHSGLIDHGCPGVWMALYSPEKKPWHRSVRNFYTAVDGDLLDTRLRTFDVEITGAFSPPTAPGTVDSQLHLLRVWTFAKWRT